MCPIADNIFFHRRALIKWLKNPRKTDIKTKTEYQENIKELGFVSSDFDKPLPDFTDTRQIMPFERWKLIEQDFDFEEVKAEAMNATAVVLKMRVPKALDGKDGYFKVFYTSGFE